MHYVYFIWSQKLQKIYIGETSDVIKRLDFHNKGLQRFTRKGLPWNLVGFIDFTDRRSALQEEKRLKKCKNRNYYRKYLVENGKKLDPTILDTFLGRNDR